MDISSIVDQMRKEGGLMSLITGNPLAMRQMIANHILPKLASGAISWLFTADTPEGTFDNGQVSL